jgi:glucokinase
MEDTSDKQYIIACDVGGTNSRFRVVQRSTTDESFREVVYEEVI